MILLRTRWQNDRFIHVVQTASGGKMRMGSLGLQAQQMAALGEYGVSLIKARVKRGIGSDDVPMKPLSGRTSPIRNQKTRQVVRIRSGYREWKIRQGLSGIRDLWGTGKNGGHMLDALSVRYADERQVRIDITTRSGRMKARVNEQRSPWFGWSTQDVIKIYAFAGKMWKGSVSDLGLVLRGMRGAPIWMDPLGLRGLDKAA